MTPPRTIAAPKGPPCSSRTPANAEQAAEFMKACAMVHSLGEPFVAGAAFAAFALPFALPLALRSTLATLAAAPRAAPRAATFIAVLGAMAAVGVMCERERVAR
eukprot:CAMPEP_0204222874 /NCGR_PEP_ID=MMETSP0361-20130328/82482_1 /ASSEMBLY_ACC=CAM_ASM_000343 /TAXON_ID=268821 /ORGANISM="Scrippsiella Hangoei, Strain SHTV-5" /LENGTH=103 /DNA_ID=CAMNT_0051188535 /DNA_START=33 /DNA_END=340 /DNA_ORIENTATION=-